MMNKNKKALLFYFSGTGNTLLVANLYKEALEKNGYSVEIIQITSKTLENRITIDKNVSLCLFGYPIHGFNPPHIFINFLKMINKLPKEEKIDAAIFKTSGEGLGVNNASSYMTKKILRKKHFNVLSERHYVMPYNMIFRHPDDIVKEMYLNAKRVVPLHVRDIINKKIERFATNPIYRLLSFIVRIEWIYAHLQGPFMKVDMNKCIKCQKCVKECPTGNIKFLGNKFKFGTKCTLCVRCSFNCPQNAISIGLLNGWKVNGRYDIENIANDKNIPDRVTNIKKTRMYRIYKKYFDKMEKSYN